MVEGEAASATSAVQDRPLVRLAVLDVGQGDAIVASIPDDREAVVIDCGDAETVLAYLQAEGIERVRGLILTHLHADHYRGAANFLTGCEEELGIPCERLSVLWPMTKSKRARELLAQGGSPLGDDDAHAMAVGAPERETALRGLETWRMLNRGRVAGLAWGPGIVNGSLAQGRIGRALQLLHPVEADVPLLLAAGLNNLSGIIKVHGSGSSALLTGDLEPRGWTRLRENLPHMGVLEQELRCDVLKFPHHGAWIGADPDELLNIVDPNTIIISVGSDGARYGHPNDRVFAAIRQRSGTRLLCTQATKQCGAVDIHTSAAVRAILPHSTRMQGGCPCAGSVIIDLGERPAVTPRPHLHVDKIIRVHYPRHACAV